MFFICEDSSSYFEIIQGQPVEDGAAQKDIIALPNGCTLENKFFYTINDNNEVIGCVDIIQGYPDQQTAFIGLLLFVESKQGLGYGHQALNNIAEFAYNWGCNHLRIAVVESNQRAFSFWLRTGFLELYHKNVKEYKTPITVMEKVFIQ